MSSRRTGCRSSKGGDCENDYRYYVDRHLSNDGIADTDRESGGPDANLHAAVGWHLLLVCQQHIDAICPDIDADATANGHTDDHHRSVAGLHSHQHSTTLCEAADHSELIGEVAIGEI